MIYLMWKLSNDGVWGTGPEGEIADQYGVEGIPQTVIIDKEGVIREVHVGYGPGLEKRLLRELNEILAE